MEAASIISSSKNKYAMSLFNEQKQQEVQQSRGANAEALKLIKQNNKVINLKLHGDSIFVSSFIALTHELKCAQEVRFLSLLSIIISNFCACLYNSLTNLVFLFNWAPSQLCCYVKPTAKMIS